MGNVRSLWTPSFVIVGGIVMLLGVIDPLESCVAILAGSAYVLLAVGVAAMFALSAFGWIGGMSGHSMWLGVQVLPYPIGWSMSIVSLIISLVRNVRQHYSTA
jgi:hypothetical protein